MAVIYEKKGIFTKQNKDHLCGLISAVRVSGTNNTTQEVDCTSACRWVQGTTATLPRGPPGNGGRTHFRHVLGWTKPKHIASKPASHHSNTISPFVQPCTTTYELSLQPFAALRSFVSATHVNVPLTQFTADFIDMFCTFKYEYRNIFLKSVLLIPLKFLYL